MQIRFPRSLLQALLAVAAVGCISALPYQGLTAVEMHELGQRAFDEGDYDETQRVLDRLFAAFPNYERAAEARLLLAESHFREGQYLSAASEYGRLVDRYPAHASAPDAALGRCRASAEQSPSIQRDQSATETAVVVCGNVVADYPGTSAAVEAARMAESMRLKLAEKLYTIGEYYFRRDFYDSAVIYWQMIENQYADTSWAPKALVGIMKAYEEIGYQDLVEEARRKILDSYPNSDEARNLANGGGQ